MIFFSNLIRNNKDIDQTVDLEALGLSHHNLADLDAPCSDLEVWETIMLLPSDKAPAQMVSLDASIKSAGP
jgi:hypothetical protein